MDDNGPEMSQRLDQQFSALEARPKFFATCSKPQ